MKKCPFCAEEIQDQAKVCKWCGKNLSKTSGFVNALRKYTIMAVLLFGLLSIFLPIVRLQLPLLGNSNYSVYSIVKQAFSRGASEGSLSIKDLYSIQGQIQKNLPEEKLDKKSTKRYLALAKVSAVILIAGYLTFLSVIIFGIFGFHKAITFLSLVSCLCATYTLVIIYLMNNALQKAMANASVDMADEPFSGLMSTLFTDIKISAGKALYILAIAMGLIFLIGIIWRQKKV